MSLVVRIDFETGFLSESDCPICGISLRHLGRGGGRRGLSTASVKAVFGKKAEEYLCFTEFSSLSKSITSVFIRRYAKYTKEKTVHCFFCLAKYLFISTSRELTSGKFQGANESYGLLTGFWMEGKCPEADEEWGVPSASTWYCLRGGCLGLRPQGGPSAPFRLWGGSSSRIAAWHMAHLPGRGEQHSFIIVSKIIISELFIYKSLWINDFWALILKCSFIYKLHNKFTVILFFFNNLLKYKFENDIKITALIDVLFLHLSGWAYALPVTCILCCPVEGEPRSDSRTEVEEECPSCGPSREREPGDWAVIWQILCLISATELLVQWEERETRSILPVEFSLGEWSRILPLHENLKNEAISNSSYFKTLKSV